MSDPVSDGFVGFTFGDHGFLILGFGLVCYKPMFKVSTCCRVLQVQ